MHGTMTRPKAEPYWTACQIISHRGHLIRADVEKADHGTFVPTYVRVKYVKGTKYAQELPLLPGYLIFQTEPDQWSEVANIDGVLDVLADGLVPRRITDDEMSRLTLEHAMGMHNSIQSGYQPRQRNSRRRRRPRPSRSRGKDARS